MAEYPPPWALHGRAAPLRHPLTAGVPLEPPSANTRRPICPYYSCPGDLVGRSMMGGPRASPGPSSLGGGCRAPSCTPWASQARLVASARTARPRGTHLGGSMTGGPPSAPRTTFSVLHWVCSHLLAKSWPIPPGCVLASASWFWP